jgi:hypothetical protein
MTPVDTSYIHIDQYWNKMKKYNVLQMMIMMMQFK